MGRKESKKSTPLSIGSLARDTTAPWKVGTLVLSVLLIISVLTGGFGYGNTGGSTQLQAPSQPGNQQQQIIPTTQPSQPSQPLARVAVKETGEPVNGDASAPVTIVEFSDYQCPFCQRAFQQTYPELQKLIKEGTVRYVIKDYPLPFHEQADEAAVAANCAGQQDKYWEMHDKLFQTQTSWAGNPTPYELFKGYAQELDLDANDFNKCIADPQIAQEVQEDIAEGSAAGVSGTPTFYINGKELVGAQPWAAFEQLIDQELGK